MSATITIDELTPERLMKFVWGQLFWSNPIDLYEHCGQIESITVSNDQITFNFAWSAKTADGAHRLHDCEWTVDDETVYELALVDFNLIPQFDCLFFSDRTDRMELLMLIPPTHSCVIAPSEVEGLDLTPPAD